MSTPRPIVRTQVIERTWLGSRAIQATDHHDTNPVGLRTITVRWLDDAHEQNGGHPAGTVTRTVVKGDGRKPNFEVIEPQVVVNTTAWLPLPDGFESTPYPNTKWVPLDEVTELATINTKEN